MAEVYRELHRLAASQLRRERPDHTLSATGLINEAWIKLSQSSLEWESQPHFFGIAARAMRQILVDHALAHRADKRGGDWQKLTLTTHHSELESSPSAEDAVDIVALHESLLALEALDPRQAEIVQLRYFAGLSIDETAEAMSLSPATVKREWTVAKLFLKRDLSR
jgi:RNA polymerase sigma factor (TIGR02999 family)